LFPPAKRHESASEPPAPTSKSRRKREMHDLQQLGEALCALDPSRLATLGLPERLSEAILLARRVTAREGRRRQLQFVGRLMRDVDPEPLRAALAEWTGGPDAERARFAAVERWRERLLRDADGVAAFVAAHPRADPAALAVLVAGARAERIGGGPPHNYRALFRALERTVEAEGSVT
jgi:ribosome-associated protein